MVMHTVYSAAMRAGGGPLVGALGSRWHGWLDRHYLPQALHLVPAILSTLPARPETPPPTSWTVQRAMLTTTKVAVITVGPVGGDPLAMVKLPCTARAAANLDRQRAVLAALHADERLGEWRAVAPMLLASGEIAGRMYVVEQALRGCDLLSLRADPLAYTRACRVAAATIAQLHRRTYSTIVADTGIVERWVDQPLVLVREAVALLPRARHYQAAIERLAMELHAMVAGRMVTVSWIHGDFWPSNLLFSQDGVTLRGIVDWDHAAAAELPMHDLLHLAMHTHAHVARQPVPPMVVKSLLTKASWTEDQLALFEAAESPLPADAARVRTMLLLYWLRNVALYLAGHPEATRPLPWTIENLESVLRCL